jgi:hypothetical protein
MSLSGHARMTAIKSGGVAAVLAAAAFTSAPPAAADTGLGLFSNSNYGGCAFYTTTFVAIYNFANYSYTAGTNCPSLNDSVSSISNAYYSSVTFYTAAGYTGNTQTIAARSQVTSVKYNDQYSSYSTN